MVRILFLQTLILQRKMGPKKVRRVREIEVPTDTPTEFKLGDMAVHIQHRVEEREKKENEEEEQTQRRKWHKNM